MKVDSFVAKAISNYPLLYYKETYEAAKLSVLHHAFIVLGNGMEWAAPKDPTKGGYLLEPQYLHDRNNDTWVRTPDPEYGAVEVRLNKKFWNEELFELSPIDRKLTDSLRNIGINRILADINKTKYVFKSNIAKHSKNKVILYPGDKYDENVHTHVLELLKPSAGREVPHPNFSKEYSCFWEIDPALIQEDWLEEGIMHLEYWQEYFNDPVRRKSFERSTAESFREHIETWLKPKRENWLDHIRSNKGYGFKDFDGENYQALADFRHEKEVQDALEFIEETLERLRNVQ